MSSPTQDKDQVLIIRMWQEPGHDDGAAADWRGRIDHLNSKARHHFVGLEALFATVRKLVANALADRPPEAG